MNEMNLTNTVPTPLPKLPSADSCPDRHEIHINITNKAFDGLARQGMTFPQGNCEIVDNALAAALPGDKARICIAPTVIGYTLNRVYTGIVPHQCICSIHRKQ